jgi:hypothetical protein
MPESEAQRITAAIAKHHPSKLKKRNRRMLKMSSEELGKMAKKPKGRKLPFRKSSMKKEVEKVARKRMGE